MRHAFIMNGQTQVILIPEGMDIEREKLLNRIAFTNNEAIKVDLREDGALVFTLAAKGKK